MGKSYIIKKTLILLDKVIECSYGTASPFGTHQAEEPKEIEEFVRSKILKGTKFKR